METKDIFDGMASRYDTEDRVNVANIIAQAMRDELTGKHAKAAMDYGCGTGLVGFALMDLFETMLFVDVSPQMVAQVQAKIERGNIQNAQAQCADFCIALPDVQVDCVLMAQTLLHVKNYRLLLRQLLKVLNPGGRLLLVDFDTNAKVQSDMVHNGFDQEALIGELRDIGFADAQAKTFYTAPNLFMKQEASLFILHAQR